MKFIGTDTHTLTATVQRIVLPDDEAYEYKDEWVDIRIIDGYISGDNILRVMVPNNNELIGDYLRGAMEAAIRIIENRQPKDQLPLDCDETDVGEGLQS